MTFLLTILHPFPHDCRAQDSEEEKAAQADLPKGH